MPNRLNPSPPLSLLISSPSDIPSHIWRTPIWTFEFYHLLSECQQPEQKIWYLHFPQADDWIFSSYRRTQVAVVFRSDKGIKFNRYLQLPQQSQWWLLFRYPQEYSLKLWTPPQNRWRSLVLDPQNATKNIYRILIISNPHAILSKIQPWLPLVSPGSCSQSPAHRHIFWESIW